jgi:hypothetical protein
VDSDAGVGSLEGLSTHVHPGEMAARPRCPRTAHPHPRGRVAATDQRAPGGGNWAAGSGCARSAPRVSGAAPRPASRPAAAGAAIRRRAWAHGPRTPGGAVTCTDAAPSARHASPSARRRSRRRTTGGGGPGGIPQAAGGGTVGEYVAEMRVATPSARRPPRIPLRPPAVAATHRGRRAAERAAGIGGAKRVMPANGAPGSYRPAQARHGRAGCAPASRRKRATGAQAARRHPGEVAARPGSWIAARAPSALPPRASPSASRRSRRRTAGRRAPERAAGIGTLTYAGLTYGAIGSAQVQIILPNPLPASNPLSLQPAYLIAPIRRRAI